MFYSTYGKLTSRYKRQVLLLEIERNKGVCPCCQLSIRIDGKGESRPVMDHNHENGRCNTAIHSRCNKGLGYFDDSPNKIVSVLNYLRKVNDHYIPVG